MKSGYRGGCFEAYPGTQTASATTLSAGPATPTYGGLLTFTATVTPLTATGTVTFYWGPYPWGTAAVVNAQAIFTTSYAFAAGTQGFTA